MAAMDARARAHIDQVIGMFHGVFIMLDDDDGVAQLAQMFEGGEQALVIALVQADGGLVQHIDHAGKAGADLRGEADALRFAAG